MKNLIKRVLGVTGITSLVIASLAGCGGSAPASQTTAGGGDSGLRVLNQAVMTGQLDYYAAVVGKDQGIFEKHGIDLQTTEYVVGIYTIDAIVNGTASVGNMANYAAVNRLGNTLHDTDLRIFSELAGGGIQNGGLYVAPEYADDLKKLDESKGFITQTGTVYDYYAAKAIEYLGIPEENQTLLNTDSVQTQLALVQRNEASAIYTSGSNATKVEGFGWKLAATSQELGIETGSYLLAKESFIAENQELLGDYLIALNETADFIKENTEQSAEIIAKATGAVKEDVQSNLEAMNCRVGLSQEGYDHLQEINDWAFAHNRFKEAYDIRDFYDTSVLELKLPELVTLTK